MVIEDIFIVQQNFQKLSSTAAEERIGEAHLVRAAPWPCVGAVHLGDGGVALPVRGRGVHIARVLEEVFPRPFTPLHMLP